jgi:potassium-dependent mechanosensitive channel
MTDNPMRNQFWVNVRRLLRQLLVAMLVSASSGQSQAAPAAPSAPSAAATAPAAAATATPSPAPIPLPEIATEAEAALARVHERMAEAPDSRTVPAVVQQFPLLTREIDARLRQTRRILSQRPSIQTLSYLESEWRPLRRNLATWNHQLTGYLSRLESEIAELDELGKVWRETLESAKASNVPPEVLVRIQAVLAEIEKARKEVDRHRGIALTLQNRVAAQDARIADALALIAQTRENALDRLFMPDSLPIWSTELRSHSTQELRTESSNSIATQWHALSAYAARQSPSFLVHTGIFIGIAAGFLWLRRRVEPRLDAGIGCSAIVCETPIAAAFLLSMFFSRWLYPQAPRLLWAFLGVLALIPTAIILRRLIARDLYPALYGLATFYLVDQVRAILVAEELAARLLLLSETLGLMAFLVWLLRSVDRLGIQNTSFGRLSNIVKIAAILALIMAAAAFVANATGYLTLASLLGNALLGSGYFALILYALVELIDSLVMIAFSLRPFRMFRIISKHGALLRRRIYRILQWTAVLLWVLHTLNRLLLRERLFRAISDFMTEELVVGSLRISLSDVVIFGVTVWAAVLASRFVRFVLDEEVFPRIHLTRGLPYAISSMVNYTIVLVGFFVGVAALGVDMTKVTILAGAFSVGVGFGLQNIFNNFVSGLILLFERPVNVGDVVQIDDASGVVERIGIRASIISTPAGAEVIVPNGKLISERVINWTFSNRRRSIELQLAVAQVADPRRVIAVLERAANEHPHISRDPPPKAWVVKLGPDSLGLELRAWTDRIHDWMEVRSELAIAVSDNLAAEKIALRGV